MSKITRFTGNLLAFGSSATGTERTVFGDTVQSDVLDDNITADFLRGWGIVGVNENPTKQDFNALGFTVSQLIAYLHQVGVPEWDSLQEFNTNSFTARDGVLFRSLSDANIGNDPIVDDGMNWERLIDDGEYLDCDYNLNTVIDTATYDAFGFTVKATDDTVLYITRQGTSHVGDKGYVVKATYTISTETWSSFSTIFTDASYDTRNIGGGRIGDTIFVFLGRYNNGTAAWVDLGYITSTDNGVTWSAFTSVTVIWSTSLSPHGHIVKISETEYMQPWYGFDGANYKVALLRSTDSGATWVEGPTIYSGATQLNEVSMEHLGSGRCIALMRNEAGGGLYQAVSSDYGQTWAAPTATNLGSGLCIPSTYSNGRDIFVAYADRTAEQLLIARAKKETAVGRPSAYTPCGSAMIGGSFVGAILGYSSIYPLPDGRFLVVAADNGSGSDADTHAGAIRFEGRNGGITSLRKASTQALTISTHDPIEFDYISADDQASYNPSTFEWTPKVSGWYRVSGTFLLETTAVTGKVAFFTVFKNALEYKRIGGASFTTGSTFHQMSGSCLIYADAGDVCQFTIWHNNTNAVTINSYNHSQFIDIERVR